MILNNADANRMRESAIRGGMITLLQDGTAKVRAGITTLSEVLRVTQEG